MLILLSHNYDLSSLFKYYYCGSLSYFTRKKKITGRRAFQKAVSKVNLLMLN